MYVYVYVNAFALALIRHKWSSQPTRGAAATTIATTIEATAVMAAKLPRCRIKSIHYEITGSAERTQPNPTQPNPSQAKPTQGPHRAAP